jgi:hypothetical protein
MSTVVLPTIVLCSLYLKFLIYEHRKHWLFQHYRSAFTGDRALIAFKTIFKLPYYNCSASFCGIILCLICKHVNMYFFMYRE